MQLLFWLWTQSDKLAGGIAEHLAAFLFEKKASPHYRTAEIHFLSRMWLLGHQTLPPGLCSSHVQNEASLNTYLVAPKFLISSCVEVYYRSILFYAYFVDSPWIIFAHHHTVHIISVLHTDMPRHILLPYVTTGAVLQRSPLCVVRYDWKWATFTYRILAFCSI